MQSDIIIKVEMLKDKRIQGSLHMKGDNLEIPKSAALIYIASGIVKASDEDDTPPEPTNQELLEENTEFKSQIQVLSDENTEYSNKVIELTNENIEAKKIIEARDNELNAKTTELTKATNRIKELELRIETFESDDKTVVNTETIIESEEPKEGSAEWTIIKIDKAEKPEDLEQYSEDTRATVKKAYEAKLQSFE